MNSKFKKIFILFISLAIISNLFSCALFQFEKPESKISKWLKSASLGDEEFIKRNSELVGSSNQNKTTALMAAASRGHIHLMKLLIELGENINALDIDQDSALFYAIAQRQEAAGILLINSGAYLGQTRRDGISPLMSAIDSNRSLVAERLIAAGAPINEITNDGWTALFFTVRVKNLALSKALVEAGANPNQADNDGLRPMDYAKEDQWLEGIHYFSKFLSKNSKKKNR